MTFPAGLELAGTQLTLIERIYADEIADTIFNSRQGLEWKNLKTQRYGGAQRDSSQARNDREIAFPHKAVQAVPHNNGLAMTELDL